MELYKRNNCIICKNNLCLINKFKQFPIMAISNNNVKNEYYDLNIMVCEKCNCLQLENLVDPYILYSKNYMNATYSTLWTNHNIFFINFILNNTIELNFLEIGSNKGELYNLLNNKKKINFITLDMFKHNNLPKDITFIEGNCETYAFNNNYSILMSHVFEHLYNPLIFIKNIYNCGIKEIFISIPNFDELLKDKSNILIYSQHTFFCGIEYIKYLFSLYNYLCDTFIIYSNEPKSIMFKFILTNNPIKLELPTTNIKLYKDIYIDKINIIKNIDIPKNSYIVPSGIYGQYIYYFINNKDNINGFIDNNPERYNNLLYGTNKNVYSPYDIDYKTSIIIIVDCPYKKEIIEGLQKIYFNINFMYI